MPQQKSIALITCYYGSFPWYFKFFLKSCAFNPTVSFIIVTDIAYSQELPQNVIFIHKPWDDLITQIDETLEIKSEIDKPYKLCDFKPAYGLIFSDLLKDYDFWGHGDIDIIFGNIRSFITDEILDTYELVNVRHDVLTGYFLLFKNNSKMNYLFTHSKDYEKVFTSPRNFYFDETNYMFDEFKSGMHYSEIHSEIESMNHVVLRLEEEGYIKPYLNFHVIEGNPGKMIWDNGTLTYCNSVEILLYHMVIFKNICHISKMKKVPDRFRISHKRIYRR